MVLYDFVPSSFRSANDKHAVFGFTFARNKSIFEIDLHMHGLSIKIDSHLML